MKNYKRILAAIGTAALLVSNVGAVSQVVFADEADIVESVSENVVDVSQDDVTAQVQEIIDEALETTAEETETQEAADTESTPAESVDENAASESTETTPAEDVNGSEDATAASTEAAGTDESTTEETSGEEQKSDETTGDETAATGTTEAADSTTGSEDVIEEIVIDEPTIEGTTEDLIDEAAAADTTEEETAEETEAEAEDVEEETEEDELISDPYEATVTVDGESGITVKATAKENILPENAVLVASMITKEDDEDAYNKVEEALIESDNVDYTVEDAIAAETDTQAADNDSDDETAEEATPGAGFIAMDIRFEVTDDETGETDEIEPKGAVNITFDIAENVLPVEADPETLTVHHLVEDEDGNVDRVETVADTDDSVDSEIDGLVQAAEAPDENTSPEVTAEFPVESFSTFTLVWTQSGKGVDEYVFIHYVDVDGNPIDVDVDRIEMGKNENYVDLRYYARDIEGKTFQAIKIRDRQDEHRHDMTAEDDHDPYSPEYDDAQFVKWVNGGTGISAEADYVHYYKIIGYETVIEDRREVEKAVLDEIGVLYQTADVYIVYKEKPKVEPTVLEPSVGGDKTITGNEDGTYDLELSVSSTNGTAEEPQKVDVLFVLDTSSSMIKNWAVDSNGNKVTGNVTGYYVSRGDAAESAIISAVDSLKNNKNIDAHYGLVTFSSHVHLTENDGYSPYKYGDYYYGRDSLFNNNDYYKIDMDTEYKWKAFKGYYKEEGGQYRKVEGLKDTYIDKDENKDDKRYIYGWFGAHQDLSETPITQTLLDRVIYAGNTNYQAAVVGTRQALSYARTDAKKIVIFLTDGLPTQAFNSDGTLWGSGREDEVGDADGDKNGSFIERAVWELKTLPLSSSTQDAFYVLAIGKNLAEDYNNYIKYVEPLVKSSYYADPEITTQAIPVLKDDASEITKQLGSILSNELSVEAEDVHISDPLSDNVELTSEDLQIVIMKPKTDAKGNLVKDGDGKQIYEQVVDEIPDTEAAESKGFQITQNKTHYTITASIVEDHGHKVIKLDFPEKYKLESGWTYKVVAKVQPTAKTYAEFRKSLTQEGYEYPDTGKGGAYEDVMGLYTNGYSYIDEGTGETTNVTAGVTYKYASPITEGGYASKTVEYGKPVLNDNNIKAGELTITKTITGLTGAALTSAVNNTAFTVAVAKNTNPNGYQTIVSEITINLNGKGNPAGIEVSEPVKNGDSYTYTISGNALKGLDKDATYTVTEKAVTDGQNPGQIDGYDVTNDNNLTQTDTIAKATVNADGTTSYAWTPVVDYTNAYSMKIVKTGVVTDNNMFPAVVATIDMMAVMAVLYTVAKRRVR